MSNLFIRALLGASLCVSIAVAEPPLPQALKGVHRVVMLGDSITQFGDGVKGYVWLVRHYLHDIFASQDIQVINAGVAGDRSNEMLARFEKDILGPKPDLITISVGVNDVWRGFSASNPKGDGPEGIPLDEFRKNVESIVSQGTAAGATVIVLSGTPIGENMQNPANVKAKDYNDALKDIASTHHLLFVDLQKPFRTLIADYRKTTGASDFFLTVDGIHMNDDGNLVMAHTLLTALGITPEMQQSVERHVFEEEQSQP